MNVKSKLTGFTLIELTVVLFIITLLLGGLLVPLGTQLEGRQRAEAQTQLDEIVEAVIGFSIINGRLPCYSIQADPTAADYGEEASPCNPTALLQDGYLPWKTLGLKETDPWGIPRTATASPWTGYWRYRVDENFQVLFTLTTSTPAGTGFVVNELSPVDSVVGTPAFNTLTSGTERPIVIIYSTGANQTADGLNSVYEPLLTNPPSYEAGVVSNLDRDANGTGDKFDDLVTWLSRPLLLNHMVKAGQLP